MATEKQPTRIIRKRIHDYIIIWADANIDGDDDDTKNIKSKLEKLVNDVQLIKEPDECIRILKEFDGTRSFVITSGALGQTLVPKIHSIDNLESIFILCGNKNYHEKWVKRWVKVQKLETNIDPIYQALLNLVNQVKNDEIAMTFIQTDENGSTTDLKQLEPSFMYTGLLKDTILTIEFTSEHIQIMVKCFLEKYKSKPNEMIFINDFGKTYRPDKAIWWYTRDCFVYNDLNRALRDLEGDIIIDMGFFINDLHRQINELHQQQRSIFGDEKFTLYRGQGLSEQAFEKAKNSKNGLLGFNCFLSTSLNRTVSFEFAQSGSRRSGCVGVLFVMKIDPSLQIVPFANIKEHSAFPTEDEILFSMHTVFKIGEVESISDYTNMYQISLELTSEDDPRLRGLKNYMFGKGGGCGEHRLAWILDEMGQYDKAEQMYLNLSDKIVNENDRGSWYHQLGTIKDRQGKYAEAIEYYEKAIDIYQRVLPENDSKLATSYNNIGLAYNNMNEHSKALINYEKSLDIKRKIFPEDNLEIAITYNNIGFVYKEIKEYSQALINHEKSLEIMKKTLPEDHPDIASSYNNIGLVYDGMGEYEKALKYYQKSLDIRSKTLPKDHPSFALLYVNMGSVYFSMEKYPEAREYLEEARRIFSIS